ncbi:S8 family serine peptidase [Nonomuraea sp. NPDC005650]|uniref:S8 family serine peptidase n=1 Tax=Nonomuraea sp. NPDC005650 TaxID=3157045 RepID=UPI0033B9B654
MTTALPLPRRTVRFAHSSAGGLVEARSVVFPGPITREWAWGGATGRGVTVCLIDSGVEADHPAIGGRVRCYSVEPEAGPARVGWSVRPDDEGDAAGHGTACAAIVRSLAPDCDLVSVRVLGRNLRGSSEALAAAVEWAVRQRFPLVNLSLSTNRPAAKERLHDVADEAYFAGVTLVSSAHNRPVASYPWRFPSVVSVGSHSAADPERVELSPDPPVEFFAAGVAVHTAWLGGQTRTVSGNSFATPHIAGLCARVLEKHPHYRTHQLKHVLAGVADNLR